MTKWIYLSQPVTNADYEFNSGTKRTITRKFRTNDWKVMKLDIDPGIEGPCMNYACVKMLLGADLVVFGADWRTSRRCLFEHDICVHCGIPYIEV